MPYPEASRVKRKKSTGDLTPFRFFWIEPEKTHLVVEGREAAVLTGMGATAEVRVGRRRVVEFFVYPLIKYLDEGLSVR